MISGWNCRSLPLFDYMTVRIDELERRMAAASEMMDFEEARRLRDQINLIRSGASPENAAQADTSGLLRQKSGAMGIGTNHPRPITPQGWKPPPKPSSLTSGTSRRR
jgi:hypothetical protein